MTLKFTGKAGRASALGQMKDLIRKFEDSKTRITKLKMYKDMITEGETRSRKVTGNKDFKEISMNKKFSLLMPSKVGPGINVKVTSPREDYETKQYGGSSLEDEREMIHEELDERDESEPDSNQSYLVVLNKLNSDIEEAPLLSEASRAVIRYPGQLLSASPSKSNLGNSPTALLQVNMDAMGILSKSSSNTDIFGIQTPI